MCLTWFRNRATFLEHGRCCVVRTERVARLLNNLPDLEQSHQTAVAPEPEPPEDLVDSDGEPLDLDTLFQSRQRDLAQNSSTMCLQVCSLTNAWLCCL